MLIDTLDPNPNPSPNPNPNPNLNPNPDQVLNDTLESRAKMLQKAKLAKLKKAELGEEEWERERERLREFIEELKEGSRTVSLEEMMAMMTYFKDDYALDSLERQKLVTMDSLTPTLTPTPTPTPTLTLTPPLPR